MYAQVEIKRNSGQNYTFAVPKHLEVKEGDTVVVRCSMFGREDNYVVGTVECLEETPRYTGTSAIKPIVDVVDVNRFERELEKEKQREALEAAMEERLRKVNKMALYRQHAENDPEMKQLLESYDLLAS